MYSDSLILILDIEVHDTSKGAQARYLVHGHDDCLWTDSIEDALAYLRESMEQKHD